MLQVYGTRLGLQLLARGRLGDSLPLLIKPVNYWRNLEYQLVLHNAEFAANDCVLDIGSPKLLALYLSKTTGAEIHSTDIDGYFLPRYQLLRELERIDPLKLHLELQDGRELGYPAKTFNKVYSISVLEHIPGEGDTRCIQEIARVLRPGGHCFITVPFSPAPRTDYINEKGVYWTSHSGAPKQGRVFYQRRYSETELYARIIEPSGLNLTKLVYVGEKVLTGWSKELADFLPAITGPVQPLLSRLFHTRPCSSWSELRKPLCAFIVLQRPAAVE